MGPIARCTVPAALAALLAACGGPPDDVAEAARKTRVAAAQAREEVRSQRADAERERTSSPAPRPVARDLPPAGTTRTPATSTAPDRSTATMGAGPAPSSAAALPETVPPPSAAALSPAEDAAITTRVRSLLEADREIGPLNLDVDTRAGTVTISGTVPTAAARARAGDIAKSVKDVKSVNDQLTLATG